MGQSNGRWLKADVRASRDHMAARGAEQPRYPRRSWLCSRPPSGSFGGRASAPAGQRFRWRPMRRAARWSAGLLNELKRPRAPPEAAVHTGRCRERGGLRQPVPSVRSLRAPCTAAPYPSRLARRSVLQQIAAKDQAVRRMTDAILLAHHQLARPQIVQSMDHSPIRLCTFRSHFGVDPWRSFP